MPEFTPAFWRGCKKLDVFYSPVGPFCSVFAFRTPGAFSAQPGGAATGATVLTVACGFGAVGFAAL